MTGFLKKNKFFYKKTKNALTYRIKYDIIIITSINGVLFSFYRGRYISRALFVLKSGRNFKFNGGADKMRVRITLACTECKQRNYDTMKSKKNDPDRLEKNKHCKFCRKHTLHRETK